MPYIIAALIAAAAVALGWLSRPLLPDPDERRRFAVAVNAVDRELAANLELTTMFDQTKQAVTLENGEFVRHRAILERNARSAVASIAALYERMSDAESAMERRGPANSLRPEDRRLIETWEGDARELQRSIRAALEARPAAGWRALSARLHGRFAHH
ncbi:MAG TPA: hypothetical protein VKE23_12590 [Candidatus Limnocylindria bacterium]|nr:hypothetical protein [Candidatus Limnocylindria bacterium]